MANIVDIIIKGKDQSKKALTAPIKNLKDLKTAAKSLGPAFKLGIGVAVAALGALVFSSIQTAEETAKLAQKLGVTAETLSTMSFAARIAGSDTATLEKGMKRLAVQVLDAGRGLKESIDNFAALGLEVRDTNGQMKTTEQLFKESADAISKMPDGLNKAALAQKVFGKSGLELIPLLNEGADGIERLEEQARSLGLEISTQTSKDAEVFIDNLEIMKSSATGLGNTLAADLLPGLNAVTDGINESSEKGEGLQAVFDGIGAAVGFLGKTVLSVFESLKFLFDITATSLASLGAKLFAVLSGDFDLIEGIDKDFKEQLVNTTEGAADRIDRIWADSNKKRLKDQKETDKAAVDSTIKKTKAQIAAEKKAARVQRTIDSAKAATAQNTSNAIFTFAKIAAGKNAKTQKRIALGEAVVNGALAVAKANSSAPWPFNLPAIAFAVAQGVAQVATINSAKFADGGIVPGPQGQTGDRVLAGLNPGEVVLNAAQSENLAAQLGVGVQGPTQFTATIDSRVLFDIIAEGSRNGQLAISKGSLV